MLKLIIALVVVLFIANILAGKKAKDVRRRRREMIDRIKDRNRDPEY